MVSKFESSHQSRRESLKRHLLRYGLGAKGVDKFQQLILHYYRYRGRKMPWRETSDWYQVLVSEFMLQQTQVSRVLPKYASFLEQFSSPKQLADASIAELINAWQGLGYNRRGLNLQRAAVRVLSEFGGELPGEVGDLLTLPGVGNYTAAALQAFVGNRPVVLVETNVRAVMIYFFPGILEEDSDGPLISEAAIERMTARTLYERDARKWYYALMDYGAMLKANGFKSNHCLAGHIRQKPFQGSFRQVRGTLLKVLSGERKLAEKELARKVVENLDCKAGEVKKALSQLSSEGFIEKAGGSWSLVGRIKDVR